MRAYTWIAFGGLLLACGGSAFTSSGDTGGEGGSDDDGGSGGKLGNAGRGGSLLGNGGKVSGGTASGGGISVGGFGIAGDLVAGGGPPIAGTAGTGPDPIPIDKACPPNQPDLSHACSPGLTCSYGSDVRSSGRARVKCEEGKWTKYPADCPPVHACDNIVQGDACDATVTAGCTIEGHIYCACTGCGNGGPCSSETVWQCAAGSGGQACPNLVPNEGQGCSGDLTCPYGSCITDGPVTATCNGATWGWESSACPQ